MSADDIDDAMAGLITDIVASAFDWARGEFSFVEKESIELPGQVDGVSMPDLMLEGVRCIEDASHLDGLLGAAEAMVLPGSDASALEQEIHLEPMEELVFSGIDGSRSLGQVFGESMMGPEMTRRFLYGLVLSGHLEVEGRKPPTLPRPSRRSRLARTRRKGGRKGVRRSVIQKRKQAAPRKEVAKPQAEAPPAIEETFEERINRLYRETTDRSHYEILGLEPSSDDQEIRKRYYELAKDYHPDKLGPDATPGLRDRLEELFGRFGEAYNVLRDKEARAEYDKQLAAGEAAHETKEVDPQQVAREAFEKGMLMMKADPAAAARFFQYAADTDPEKAEYWAHLGSALGKQSMSHKKAEDAFKKAISLEQTNSQHYFKLALLYRAGGLKSRAADMIRQGLSWEPDNFKMQTLLSELEGGDEKKGGGLFRRK